MTNLGKKLVIGEPCVVVTQDYDKLFEVGDLTFVNNLFTAPVDASGKTEDFAMVQGREAFIVLPAAYFRPLTEEEEQILNREGA